MNVTETSEKGDARAKRTSTRQAWMVYLLHCADGSLYTGITTNLERRLRQHNGELAGGARYTRPRQPVRLAWCETAADRASAARAEYRIRKLPRAQKLRLAATYAAQQSAAESINE